MSAEVHRFTGAQVQVYAGLPRRSLGGGGFIGSRRRSLGGGGSKRSEAEPETTRVCASREATCSAAPRTLVRRRPALDRVTAGRPAYRAWRQTRRSCDSTVLHRTVGLDL